MPVTAEQTHSNVGSGGRFETMTNTRDTRTVMIVDSEPAQQPFLAALVSRGGWRSVVAADTDTALAKLGTQEGMALDAVLVDQGAPGMDMAEFVAELRRWRPALPLVVITMRNGVEVAVGAMRAGASDFVQKPIAPDRLLEALDRVVSTSGPQGELRPLTEKLRAPPALQEIIGSSPNFRTALAIAAPPARARRVGDGRLFGGVAGADRIGTVRPRTRCFSGRVRPPGRAARPGRWRQHHHRPCRMHPARNAGQARRIPEQRRSPDDRRVDPPERRCPDHRDERPPAPPADRGGAFSRRPVLRAIERAIPPPLAL